jgi:two-component system chemotaxis response regulator CheB
VVQFQRVVVIGASAGGLEALKELVRNLPADFPAAVCVVMHTSPQSPAVLNDILTRAGRLAAVNATNGERLLDGRIYVAPPDHHLLVEPGRVRVTRGPKENRFRPAIDPLFRSAAQVSGPAAIGVILTGNLDDGTAGLWAVKRLGGIAVVQHPDDASFPSMPLSALKHVNVDHVVPLSQMGALLTRLTRAQPFATPLPASNSIEIEVNIAKTGNALDAGVETLGGPSRYACPECHGVLLELKEGDRLRFRCHTGHAYSTESLLAALNEGIDESLWLGVRALEEGALLMSHLAAHMREQGDRDAASFARAAEDAHDRARRLRQLTADANLTVAAGAEQTK